MTTGDDPKCEDGSDNWVCPTCKRRTESANSDCDDCVNARNREREVRLQVGPELFRFSSFTNWVNKASSWFRGVRPGTWVCIDQRGRICNSGKEFMRADEENAFPIVVYLIDPEAEL